MSFPETLPALDCHAHIAADVTPAQVRSLDGAVVFAVTRSLDESRLVAGRSDPGLVWGCGVHPGVKTALNDFDRPLFESLVDRFLLVGEVGLDRRSGGMAAQEDVFTAILDILQERAVLTSIHSAGCAEKVVEALSSRPLRGAILHWFLGDQSGVEEAARLGCSFSVNVAMSDDQIGCIPRDRILPETDFPHVLRGGANRPRRPADVSFLETRLSKIWSCDVGQVRRDLFRNLRETVRRAGMMDSIPESLADLLLAV